MDEAGANDHDLPDDAVGGPVGVADDDVEVVGDGGDGESKWEEYAFEAGDVGVAAEILRAAAPDSTIMAHDISNAVIRAAKHNPAVRGALEREVACAFMYRIKIDRSGSPTAGATLEPSKPAQLELRPRTRCADSSAAVAFGRAAAATLSATSLINRSPPKVNPGRAASRG